MPTCLVNKLLQSEILYGVNMIGCNFSRGTAKLGEVIQIWCNFSGGTEKLREVIQIIGVSP